MFAVMKPDDYRWHFKTNSCSLYLQIKRLLVFKVRKIWYELAGQCQKYFVMGRGLYAKRAHITTVISTAC